MKLIASGVANCAAIDEVALVLAIGGVDDHDELAVADVVDRLVDRRERRGLFDPQRVVAISVKSYSSSDGLIAATARSARARAGCSVRAEQALDVLGEHVDLEVHHVAVGERAERRRSKRVRNQRDGERVAARGPRP